MKKMSRTIKIIFYLLIMSFTATSQTANVTAGCAELKVEFTAPSAASYFWKFGDGVSSVSTLQNPVHSYVQPGSYTAQLFDEENGTQIDDDIIITVYPPIAFEIDADVRSGCAPLDVNFTSTIDIDPNIDVEDIVWTFGDGNSASGQNTNYTYTESGVYTISLKVITDAAIKCDEPIIFPDYISVEGEKTNFLINKFASCDLPAEFIFNNATNGAPGTTYLWDFGNGQTSTLEGPHTINYTTAGLFYPELTSTTMSGCITSFKRTISLGAPIIVPILPDTICVGEEVQLNQTTIAQAFLWDFIGTSIDTSGIGYTSDEIRPFVRFKESGLQTFTLTAIAPDGCETTVTLDIFVFAPNANYTVGPQSSCQDPVLIEYTAADPDLFVYTFNNDISGDGVDVIQFTPIGSVLYEHPERDEYYINTLDSVTTRLIVTSAQGCTDTAYRKYLIQKPEAFFIPDVIKGCVPFEVNFSDLSYSDFEIQTRDWNFGDGQNETYSTDDILISHVYTTPGIHEAILTITDENGCIDVSREVQIIAIDKVELEGMPEPFICPDIALCVGDNLLLGVTTDQINTNLHIESDEGRFNHCWREVVADHTFQYPGVYPLDVTLEFFTVYIDSLTTGCEITVEGSRSDIDFFIDCADPYVVQLSSDNSINADSYAWFLDDVFISNESSLSYTFEERGSYTIYLETEQNGVDCKHRDSAIINITEIKAEMSIPSQTCASSPIFLNAEGSEDVHDDCWAGYLWQFENQRPREVNDTILKHTLLPGFQTITLIVEDINGCTDTISANTTAYDLEAEFTTDTLICLPTELQLSDLSVGDTTIVGWSWDFGGSNSDEQNPLHEFNLSDYDPAYEGDSITVTLQIVDALGCIDDTSFLIRTYDILSELFIGGGPTVCQNETITFSALDYTVNGSFLNYQWDFGVYGTSTEDDPVITFTEAGDFPITLLYTEDASGCQGFIDTMITVIPGALANFTSDQDSTEFICFPEQISFTNTSTVESGAIYQWDFGNGAQSDIENPVIPFDKGTYEVQLIVRTFEGCRDTITKSYTLVGPEGTFTIDKDVICPGEEITLTLENTSDVSSYTWDFGDGVQIDDQSPVTHIYDQQTSVNVFTPTLILRSDDNGCELIQNIPITVSSITADFDFTADICPGEISFSSGFVNAQNIQWIINGETINNTDNPSVAINSNDSSIDVTLFVTDQNGCEIERQQTVEIPNSETSVILYPNVFSPNGDDLNPNFNIHVDENFEGEVDIIAFKVYNRWGELLYNNDSPTIGWDGSYKGEIVPPDIYAYYIEVALDGCKPSSKKGNVTVIK